MIRLIERCVYLAVTILLVCDQFIFAILYYAPESPVIREKPSTKNQTKVQISPPQFGSWGRRPLVQKIGLGILAPCLACISLYCKSGLVISVLSFQRLKYDLFISSLFLTSVPIYAGTSVVRESRQSRDVWGAPTWGASLPCINCITMISLSL